MFKPVKTRTTIWTIGCLLLVYVQTASSQITTPIIRAGFGVDADLRRNFFNQDTLTGNDDWFGAADDSTATGESVIDTTGAAAVYTAYSTNPGSRFYSFTRGMRYPILSVINDRIYYDAVYIRDYHGTDSTSFTGGSKNGQSPADWSTAISPVLSKNDIIDGYLHVRRDGTHTGDSLWFFGGVGILGTNGDRYFDFELYQTDITFNRITGKFENYGPDAGHTSWQFAPDGSTTRVGDIILTAEYGNAGLNFIEARIWIDKAALLTTPQAFSWTGSFDGASAGSTYGYAGIQPVNGGTFYQGLQNAATISTGPFGTIQSGDVPSLSYNAIQFMEFSVNLTKLGLDPMSFTTGSLCNLAFGKVLIKTRTSTSFTASITDFASPFSFRALPQVNIAADIPLFCMEQNLATITVLNPLPTSTYSFSTVDGHILTTGATSIVVDSPGTYIVIQHLLDGCAEGGRDTVRIIRQPDNSCVPLAVQTLDFKAVAESAVIQCTWETTPLHTGDYIIIEKAGADMQFVPVYRSGESSGRWSDKKPAAGGKYYYRLTLFSVNGQSTHSRIIVITVSTSRPTLRIAPNPAKAGETIQVFTGNSPGIKQVQLTDLQGRKIFSGTVKANDGYSLLRLPALTQRNSSYYILTVQNNQEQQTALLLLTD